MPPGSSAEPSPAISRVRGITSPVWPAPRRRPALSSLFSLALEKGTSGALYHAVAGETPTRWIAERVADDLGCGTRSVDEGEAAAIWGQFGATPLVDQERGYRFGGIR